MTQPAAIEWDDPAPGGLLTVARALRTLETAVARMPERLDLKLRLADALFHSDRMAEIVVLLAPEIEAGGTDPELNFHFGRAAALVDALDVAILPLRIATCANIPEAAGELARALRRAGKDDEALETGLSALDLRPSDYRSLQIVARILLARGAEERLMSLCDSLQARSGRYAASILAVRGVAAAVLGRTAEVVGLAGRDAHFSAIRLVKEPGLDAALAAELLGHKDADALPSVNATRGAGKRISDLHDVGGPAVHHLLDLVRTQIAQYLADHSAFTAGAPARRLQLDSWALLCGDSGHEDWHIHPSGLVSGVYYVAVPAPETVDPLAGAIGFGPLPLCEDADTLAWPRWELRPEPGLLLLFPSHFAHRTWPSGRPEARICIAFDAVPHVEDPPA
ncbi:MAG TPA: putative 2OG-Fe(II) oxygenase [Aliidongia sp.]|uniref:2OG-Fe(II) oxygenase family protein n=1 Tax=Aliidongia sp. TaxID=1914230 RepID=UPI002DDD2438|nr:putative 2OG-Fe(II) oxygenase [Aliidongia sp.]HEV2674714.1 putative 2OG-Fe(II) oxygenase [Aliidongia sp.]